MSQLTRLLQPVQRPSCSFLARCYSAQPNNHQVSPKSSAKTAEQALTRGPDARQVAMPRPPPNVPSWQAPDREMVWSQSQNPRHNAMRGPRFEQTNMEFQPMPRSAIELIAQEPIRLVNTRIAGCDGGGGALGHPKVFINLDKPGPKACGYWIITSGGPYILVTRQVLAALMQAL